MIYPWDIIGHDRQLLALEQEIGADQLSHAYLFHGPKDTGKFRVAMTLASILLCSHNLCHQCRDCQLVKSGVHPDLITFSDQGDSIKIDEVRALIQKTNLTSTGARRVILIENLERMPVEAQNSFLKTLEEPSGQSIFLMTSSQPKKILPTVLSRVRQQSFSLVEDQTMRQVLSKRFQNHEDFDDVLQMAQGRPGLAIQFLSEPNRLLSYKSLYNQVDHMLKNNDLMSKFAYIESIESDPEQLEHFFDVFFQILRRAVYEFMVRGTSALNPRFDLKALVDLFEYLVKTRYLIDRNVNKKLALENFLLLTEK